MGGKKDVKGGIQKPWDEGPGVKDKRESILKNAKMPKEWRFNEDFIRMTESWTHPIDRMEATNLPFLSAQELEIVNWDSKRIIEATTKGTKTVEEVTMAFCHAAAVAHQISNCLLEFFPDKAIERAKRLDADRESGKTLPPLFGLPVSLKDQFHVKGVETTMGYVGHIGHQMGVEQEDGKLDGESQCVTELLELGAVLFCKTSVPQTLMSSETMNNIIGTTYNPHNVNLSAGGSSGGEGALIALGGSSVGLGTDIGGSGRIPAAFCGIFSLKPTPQRISYKNAANTNPGQTAYPSTVAYFSRSIPNIMLMLESVLSTKPWLRDPAVVPIPWRQKEFDDNYARRGECDTGRPKDKKAKLLKIAIVNENGILTPHPPVLRAMDLVKKAIEYSGHKVVDWTPTTGAQKMPEHKTPMKLHNQFYFADGSTHIYDQLAKSDPTEPLIDRLKDGGERHKAFEKEDREKYPHNKLRTLLEYQDLNLKCMDWEVKFSDHWNESSEDDGQIVDAFISPVNQCAAVRHGMSLDCKYTEIANLLNYSAAVIPVTKVDMSKDNIEAYKGYDWTAQEKKHSTEADREYDHKHIKQWTDNPSLYEGAPVGVQIVCRKFEEEKVMAIALIVHEAVERYKKMLDRTG